MTSSVALGTLAIAGLVTFVPPNMAARDRERPPSHAAVDYVRNSHAEPAREQRRGANRWRLPDRTAVDCDPDRVRGLHGVACRSQPPLDPRLLQRTAGASNLGASNTARYNEEITDSAPCDDIELTGVTNHDAGAPYQIINTTLSLVGGSDLAMSQRSAENFIMSRYHCGSARAGYRCTAEYMDGQLSLATATAVSGAAVSPNMGSKTPSAALALFLSLFNVRLGFWAPTPSGRRWREPHARLWPFYILRETLSNTGQMGSYCYLTDGGHFDNTGLYALVERGCRYIVVSDCGADPDRGSKTSAWRFDAAASTLAPRSTFASTISPGGHGAIGSPRPTSSGGALRITGTLDMLGLGAESAHGVIVWIKPAVTPKDAMDVQQYHRANTDFPQQSTRDQWYDESQFESYRRLGYAAPSRPSRICLPVVRIR